VNSIRWGMIGCGDVCEVKSGPGFYKAAHSTLLGVAARDPAKVRDYAARHGVPRMYRSAEDLLRDPEIDAVYIATPPASHKPLALAAARAGKPVLLEKPMALRFAECEEIIAEFNRLDRKLFVAFYRRAMPRFLKIKEWIDTGAIGDVRCVGVVQHLPPAPEELSPATLPWRLKSEIAGGGKFLDMGVHMLDFFDFVLGPIEEVHGIATNQGGLYDVEDTVTAAWRHAGGVLGTGSWSYVCGNKVERVWIVGARGRIDFEFFADTPLRLTTAQGAQELAIPNPPHVHQPFIQTVVNELLGRGRCPGSAASAARTSFVADAILAAFRVRSGTSTVTGATVPL
jgi:1,5-anhydro-D-fructose reductase (1,5-anhydro-D-mannitol-forming)